MSSSKKCFRIKRAPFNPRTSQLRFKEERFNTTDIDSAGLFFWMSRLHFKTSWQLPRSLSGENQEVAMYWKESGRSLKTTSKKKESQISSANETSFLQAQQLNKLTIDSQYILDTIFGLCYSIHFDTVSTSGGGQWKYMLSSLTDRNENFKRLAMIFVLS